jgi:two-component sensor histidine kinase
VSLRWGIADQGGEALLDVHWREHGGPPVQAPQRKGFGSVLIERSLSAYTSGKTEAAFDAEGFAFTLHARLEDVSIDDGNN